MTPDTHLIKLPHSLIASFNEFRRKFIRKRNLKNISLKLYRCFLTPKKYNSKRYTYLGNIKIKTRRSSFRMKATEGYLENEIFWKGVYKSLEPETVWIIEKLSLNADCIIDIGANTGLYSLFVKAINPGCNIHSFEPSKKTYNELKENILLNSFNIEVNNIAISDKNGISTFYDTFEDHQYSASLSPMMLKENPSYTFKIDEYQVEVITLDSYVAMRDIKIIDLIKIDVELYEPEVFNGMLNTLSKLRPFLLFEVLTDHIGDKLSLCLTGLEYEMFHFEKKGNNYHLIKVLNLRGRTDYDWNYFACHKDRIVELKHLNLLK